jgi:hypothetical protein
VKPTEEELAALDAAAAQATPGPWALWDGCSWRRFGSESTGLPFIEPITYSESDRHPDLRVSREDAAYLALCAPERIRALVAAYRESQAENARIRSSVAKRNDRRCGDLYMPDIGEYTTCSLRAGHTGKHEGPYADGSLQWGKDR